MCVYISFQSFPSTNFFSSFHNILLSVRNPFWKLCGFSPLIPTQSSKQRKSLKANGWWTRPLLLLLFLLLLLHTHMYNLALSYNELLISIITGRPPAVCCFLASHVLLEPRMIYANCNLRRLKKQVIFLLFLFLNPFCEFYKSIKGVLESLELLEIRFRVIGFVGCYAKQVCVSV